MTSPTSSASYSFTKTTGVQNVDSLMDGTKWTSSTISYSIASTNSYWSTSTTGGYGPSTGGKEPWSVYAEPLSAAEATQFRTALAQWSNVANLNFVETTESQADVGDIRIGYSWMQLTDDAEAWSYDPDGTPRGGDIWINAKGGSHHASFAPGTYSFLAMLHELGHALGLKHPFETSPLNSTVINPADDTLLLTLMSYSAAPGVQGTHFTYFPTTPMVLDIAAAQAMYGKNMTFNAGDTTYTFKDGENYMQTIWDAGGNNTIAYSGAKGTFINLNEGQGSYLGNTIYSLDLNGKAKDSVPNVWLAYGVSIRNAVGGSGDDFVLGNNLGDNFTGGAGNDVMFGGTGADRFIGLNGKDAYYGGTGNDVLQLSSGVAQSHIVKLRDNAFFIRDTGGNAAIVRDVEQVQFSDKMTNLSSLPVMDNVDHMLIDIYVAAFRRAPELSGYQYWAQQEALKGLKTVADIIFSLDGVKAIYPTALTSSQFVTSIYGNVFNRTPDSEGLNYWIQQLNSKSRGQLVIDMTNAALGAPDSATGKDFFQNRVDWAQYAVGYQTDKHTELTPAHLTDLTNGIGSDPLALITLIGNAESGGFL